MTSRKLLICLLASMVMRNPLLLKMRHIYFLMLSVSLGVALPFFCQDICLWIKMEFLAWIIMFLSSVVMLS